MLPPRVFGGELKNKTWLTDSGMRFGVLEVEARKTWNREWIRDSTLMLLPSQASSIFGYPQARFFSGLCLQAAKLHFNVHSWIFI